MSIILNAFYLYASHIANPSLGAYPYWYAGSLSVHTVKRFSWTTRLMVNHQGSEAPEIQNKWLDEKNINLIFVYTRSLSISRPISFILLPKEIFIFNLQCKDSFPNKERAKGKLNWHLKIAHLSRENKEILFYNVSILAIFTAL